MSDLKISPDVIEALNKLVQSAVESARKPSEYEAEQLAKEADMRERAKVAKKIRGDVELEGLANAQERLARCSHRKEDGSFATGGQVLSDGKSCLTCLFCGRLWQWEASRAEMDGSQPFRGRRPPFQPAPFIGFPDLGKEVNDRLDQIQREVARSEVSSTFHTAPEKLGY